ncbi:unnamed protein product [Orchesella dallaii]|uniref:Uncharacterized protein n=1 Tax=Orchesella dallaii TaxID=48710 RepID=A0ABP1RWW9_9HEXA
MGSCFKTFLSIDPCCGLVKLWIASTVVAGIEIVLSISAIIIFILSLATINMYKTEDAYRNSRMSTFLVFWDEGEKHLDVDEIAKTMWQVFGVALFLSILNLGFASLLLYAIKSRKILLVRVWIVFKALGISICIIYLLTMIILGRLSVVGVVLDLTEIGVLFYFLWVVYAFMKELVEEQVLKMSPSIIQTQGKIEVSFPL